MSPVIVATGPLTSSALSADIAAFVGREHLAFFDAISPDRARRVDRHDEGVSRSRAGIAACGAVEPVVPRPACE